MNHEFDKKLQNIINPHLPIEKNKENENFLRKVDQNQKNLKGIPGQTLRIIPLGGLDEIGKNCTVLEYGPDIIIVDLGLQFPREGMHGIQYIIPDYTYLEKNKHKIRGILITHAHLDHIGAIPYVLEALDLKIPIFGSDLTCKIIEKRQVEFGRSLSLRTVKAKDKIKLGNFSIEFFHVNHTIPGCLGLSINTPIGRIVTLGDWKIDYTPVGDHSADLGHIAEIGKQGVLALLADSTNAYKEGFQKSETEVMNTIDRVFSISEGRIIIGTFASSLSRIQQIILLAEKHKRKLFFTGSSMLSNVEIAKELKYLKYNKETIIQKGELSRLPENKIVIACTGVQGEENAALGRIASGQHADIKIIKGDHFIFSSSVIPGNEVSIQSLLDKIYKRGGKVFNVEELAVHAGGHAKAEEVKLVYNLLKPRFYLPVHGSYYLLAKHKELIESMGHNKKHVIILENGSILQFQKDNHFEILEEKVAHEMIAIDGLGIGDIGLTVLKDRTDMAESGIFVIVLLLDSVTNKLIKSPEIISRGFVYLKTSDNLIEEAKKFIVEFINNNQKLLNDNPSEFKNNLRTKVDNFLFKKTEREPMIIPVIIKS